MPQGDFTPTISSKSSIFTVDVPTNSARPGPSAYQPNEMSFEVAVVAFGDDGLCSHPSQLTAALRCIEQARSGPSAGAVVLLFIHGWHHGSSWDDTHFVAFREVLKRLACREAERYGPLGASGRRVVGIYLSWNGDPENTTLLRAGWLSLLTFWNRYSVAGSVGQANDFRDALRAIILSAKSPDRVPVAWALIHTGSPLPCRAWLAA